MDLVGLIRFARSILEMQITTWYIFFLQFLVKETFSECWNQLQRSNKILDTLSSRRHFSKTSLNNPWCIFYRNDDHTSLRRNPQDPPQIGKTLQHLVYKSKVCNTFPSTVLHANVNMAFDMRRNLDFSVVSNRYQFVAKYRRDTPLSYCTSKLLGG